jgi:hypothetical protein
MGEAAVTITASWRLVNHRIEAGSKVRSIGPGGLKGTVIKIDTCPVHNALYAVIDDGMAHRTPDGTIVYQWRWISLLEIVSDPPVTPPPPEPTTVEKGGFPRGWWRS